MERSTISAEHHDVAPKHGAIGHLSADEELAQAVCQALIADNELDSKGIGVRAAQETVVLSGEVRDGTARERAVAIARAQRGVTDVRADELRWPGASTRGA